MSPSLAPTVLESTVLLAKLLRAQTIGIEGFLILFCIFLGRCLRNESLGFVPVFEFLFTGVCRREQKLEVKNCEV